MDSSMAFSLAAATAADTLGSLEGSEVDEEEETACWTVPGAAWSHLERFFFKFPMLLQWSNGREER